MEASQSNIIPVFLLKTKSTPIDGYEEYFSNLDIGPWKCQPIFSPVLEHRFNGPHLLDIKQLLVSESLGSTGKYGGVIFTSQRAVEAFRKVVHDIIESNAAYSLPQNLPYYVVGPATFKTLAATPTLKRDKIYGEASGNGEALARYILEHYNQESLPRAPLLFPVGEQRRDIIPRTLMNENLSEDQRIQVTELTVYETGVMESFEDCFKAALEKSSEAIYKWVVVFSPTGCEATLRSLGLLDPITGKAKAKQSARNVFLATIGPTTRDFLINKFGFEPDVCAETPNAEGVGEGILRFMKHKKF